MDRPAAMFERAFCMGPTPRSCRSLTKFLFALSGLSLAAISVAGPARAVPPKTYERCVTICYFGPSREINSCLNYCAAKYPTRTAITRPKGPKDAKGPKGTLTRVTRRKRHQ